MTKQIVYRDKNGKPINIGEWDHMLTMSLNPDTGEEEEVECNPIPDGATSAEEEIITLDDGGLAAANQ